MSDVYSHLPGVATPPKRPAIDVPEYWYRPLMVNNWQPNPGDKAVMRLIGLELRLRDPAGYQEELEMVPLHIEIPGSRNGAYAFSMPCTLHTSVGDVGFEFFLPATPFRAP